MLPLEQTVVWFSFMIATTIFAYRMRVIDRFGAIADRTNGFCYTILWFGFMVFCIVNLFHNSIHIYQIQIQTKAENGIV